MNKYRSRHLVANHKSSSQKDFGSKMDIDINIVNVNIDINFGQVPVNGTILYKNCEAKL